MGATCIGSMKMGWIRVGVESSFVEDGNNKITGRESAPQPIMT